MQAYRSPLYLNRDQSRNQDIILSQSWPPFSDLLVLDEIHKTPDWKNYLKGLFDTKARGLRILVTGSARLDTFRQGGDSLAGRFLAHRLLPISPAEARAAGEKRDLSWHLAAGGFPEPWLASSEAEIRRWRNQYLDGLIREDILEFSNIHQLKAMNSLVRLLRERIGSLPSFQALPEDLHVSPNTVAHHLEIPGEFALPRPSIFPRKDRIPGHPARRSFCGTLRQGWAFCAQPFYMAGSAGGLTHPPRPLRASDCPAASVGAVRSSMLACGLP